MLAAARHQYARLVGEQRESNGARAQLVAAAASLEWGRGLPPLADESDSRPAAVLVLLGVLDHVPATTPSATVAGDLDVLLQRRAPTLRSHAGEMSFPGGRRDPGDRDATATALREAREETGLDPAGVDVLAELPELPLAASNHRVTPVLGWWREPSRVAAVDHAETVEVFRVPVAHLLEPANRFTVAFEFRGVTRRTPAFDLDGTIVWGFTAMVLDRLFDAAGWAVPWDVGNERFGRPGVR